MKKYYAVIEGRGKVPEICSTWKSCKEKVEGYPHAKFKGFKSLEEAKDYIENHAPCPEQKTMDGIVAYVDGSYSVSKNNYSYGVVILKDGTVIKTMNSKGGDPEAVKMRQVYGELLGVMKAVDFAVKKKEEKIHVYYDYYGIERWATGKWKRNNKFTQDYHDFMQKKMKQIEIIFHKVAAHSGDKYNDMADKLAKDALL